MGRKQKLRLERRAKKKNNLELPQPAEVLAATTNDDDNSEENLDDVFPKSRFCVQADQLRKDCEAKTPGMNMKAISDIYMRGAIEHGCVHSFYMMGGLYTTDGGKRNHLSTPLLLEGALRGSANCTYYLVEMVYTKAVPYQPNGLVAYWMKMISYYMEPSSTPNPTVKSQSKDIKDAINRRCAICSKVDTDTLTLRQCIGCSMYCYCGDVCQTIQWTRGHHRNECKQIRILNKYHKPYAKEIRAAAIRGETTHPRLKKLRNKLGLSRPVEDYQELRDANTTSDGKVIDPYEYLIARTDGTVWIGSTPNSIGPSSDATTDFDIDIDTADTIAAADTNTAVDTARTTALAKDNQSAPA